AALMKARPVPQFVTEIRAHPTASPSLTPGARAAFAESAAPARILYGQTAPADFMLQAPPQPVIDGRLQFDESITIEANAAIPVARFPRQTFGGAVPEPSVDGCAGPIADEIETEAIPTLSSLKPLGQLRESFILAVNHDGLWIIDQHVAHERVLFEKVLRQRAEQQVESQRLLMPIVIELTPAQQAVFAEISDELGKNGFEAELLDQFAREDQALNLDQIRTRIAASIACHAAIKVNMPLEQNKMEWLLRELAKTDCPMSCPHGRPVVLRYSMKDIQRAFKRICRSAATSN